MPAHEPSQKALIFTAAVVATMFAMLFGALIWLVLRRHNRLKKIKKALESLEKETKAVGERLSVYVTALNTLIKHYRADKAGFAPELRAYKGVVNTLFLPPINVAKIGDILEYIDVHDGVEVYHALFHFALRLNDFTDHYVTFYAKVNANYVQDLDDFVALGYHAQAASRPDVEYLKNANTERNADRAIDYFEDFAPLVYEAQDTVTELGIRLPEIIRLNRHLPWP